MAQSYKLKHKTTFRRDDLKFKTMAKYKTLRDADIITHDLIEEGILRKPSIKGIALSNSSVEDNERVFYDEQSDDEKKS